MPLATAGREEVVVLPTLGAWLVLALLAQAPSPPEAPLPPGSVSGRVFDAYLDVRIALVRESPDLAEQVAHLEDLTPIRARLAPWLQAYGTDFEGFARSHGLVARDPGLRSRVEAILERHAPRSGAAPAPGKAPPEEGAIIPPPAP